MLKRLLLGLVLGLVVGALVAAGVVAGAGWLVFPAAVVAYGLAAATGVLTGLVAGKPIWAKGGQIEAGLKAFFGALLAAGGMFALRTWANFDVDLSILHGGHGDLGELPAASLPIIAAVLAGFYELDNTPEPDDKKAGGGARVATKARVAEDAEADEEASPPAGAKKRSR
jgi:hypothetical protein